MVNRRREGGADVSPGLPHDGPRSPRRCPAPHRLGSPGWARCRNELLPGSHWYAEMLCVDPGVRGDGLGAVLTRDGLALAEPTGTPTFLEADSARNASMDAELGFELTEHGHDDRLDLPVWRMVHRVSRTDPRSTPPRSAEPATAIRSGG
jgi:GNAT superfamily N-acetyltransferase